MRAHGTQSVTAHHAKTRRTIALLYPHCICLQVENLFFLYFLSCNYFFHAKNLFAISFGICLPVSFLFPNFPSSQVNYSRFLVPANFCLMCSPFFLDKNLVLLAFSFLQNSICGDMNIFLMCGLCGWHSTYIRGVVDLVEDTCLRLD